ncbi:Hypothetical predicted protein [Octopus vulgaris]|uniref:Uncharacterized protein n=1 Tax=Octopus vulgaris TaxID=6645 RepID=A0AA36FAB4_OCTVU|nr:Hypothetical predicted protein [Octopus vulgaris]
MGIVCKFHEISPYFKADSSFDRKHDKVRRKLKVAKVESELQTPASSDSNEGANSRSKKKRSSASAAIHRN